jgi:solute carrier family 25 2-oxodicarboxylate transporter 21
MVTESPLPFYVNVAAGAMAGGTELLMMYPLDTVKTRLQMVNEASVSKDITAAKRQHSSVLGTLFDIAKREGPLRLYRGMLSPLMVEPVKRAAKFAYNEEFKKLFYTPDAPLTRSAIVAAGFLTGASEALTIAPFELVKVRLQSASKVDAYLNTFHAFRSVWSHEGARGLLIGAPCAMARNGIWAAAYFAVIGEVRAVLPATADCSTSERTARNFVAGFVGSTIATTLNTPFDVLCSRQRDTLLRDLPTSPYRHFLPGMALIARTEGVRALWKGYVAKIMRLAPGGGIMLVVFDLVTRSWREKMGSQ